MIWYHLLGQRLPKMENADIKQTEITRKPRDYGFDNSKLVLIILVVFAHLLEISSGHGSMDNVYRIIYTFHMPAFIFAMGFFASFKPKNILVNMVLYLGLQMIYIVVSNGCWGTNLEYQVITPYWLLWFLLAMVMYQILVPVFDFRYKKLTWWILLIMLGVFSLTVGLSLLIGNYEEIGYSMSLSRFFTFLPYFVLGIFLKKIYKDDRVRSFRSKLCVDIPLRVFFLMMFVLVSVYIVNHKDITDKMLYGSYGYGPAGFEEKTRFLLFLMGLAGTGFIFITLRLNIKIPVLTSIGQNTMPVFLFHGFVIRTLKYKDTLVINQLGYFPILMIALLVVLVLGNYFVGYAFDYVYRLKFIGDIKKLINKNNAHNEDMD